MPDLLRALLVEMGNAGVTNIYLHTTGFQDRECELARLIRLAHVEVGLDLPEKFVYREAT